MSQLIFILIRFYQLTLSSILGRTCRFHPTCSAYAYEAIQSHGLKKGLVLTIKRLSKCHPWSKKDGIDFVPQKPIGKKQHEQE